MERSKVNQVARILLVEDDLAQAVLIERVCDRLLIPVILEHISTGEAALTSLLESDSQTNCGSEGLPDLILLDLHLPGIDGIEVLKFAKQSTCLRNIPVVIFTTSSNEEDLARAYNNYANSYIAKTGNINKFNQLVSDTINYWLTINHPAPISSKSLCRV